MSLWKNIFGCDCACEWKCSEKTSTPVLSDPDDDLWIFTNVTINRHHVLYVGRNKETGNAILVLHALHHGVPIEIDTGDKYETMEF